MDKREYLILRRAPSDRPRSALGDPTRSGPPSDQPVPLVLCSYELDRAEVNKIRALKALKDLAK